MGLISDALYGLLFELYKDVIDSGFRVPYLPRTSTLKELGTTVGRGLGCSFVGAGAIHALIRSMVLFFYFPTIFLISPTFF
jgi:hypothetical protein